MISCVSRIRFQQILRPFEKIAKYSSVLSKNAIKYKCESSMPIRPFSSLSVDVEKERIAFLDLYKDIRSDLLEYTEQYDPHSVQWMDNVLEYNVKRGKKNRGQVTVLAYKLLADKSQITPENIKLVQLVAWCSEAVEGALFICDDIIDGSVTRRGQTCWHNLEHVGLQAINDIFLLENGVYKLLNKYFSHTDYYDKILEIFTMGTFVTTLGQSLDLLGTRRIVTEFNMRDYIRITEYKTCYGAFYLPICLPMVMCGYKDPEVYEETKNLLFQMGHYFQIQNDYLDCFGDPKDTGRIGTDIEEHKYSWMAVACIERASKDQKEIMRQCYGKKEAEKTARVKELYKDLGIPELYATYEAEVYDNVRKRIEQSKVNIPKQLFYVIWDKVYTKSVPS